jgi:hypothetical protein
LLTKASRLFTGTLQGRVAELIQNARRAGAKNVTITNSSGKTNVVTVQDDGRGIGDFTRLLGLGESGWEEKYEASEDPAGVGLFCLAPKKVTVRSRGWLVQIEGEGWRGAPIEVRDDPEPVSGAVVQFEDETWTHAAVALQAVFSGMTVTVDSYLCDSLPFISRQAVHLTELGCRVAVCEDSHLTHWHRRVRRNLMYCDNVLVNFHGQTTSFDFHPVEERGLQFLVDLTGEPTELRLMLPARTQLVQNDALTRLTAALELEAYRYIQRRGSHSLPYKGYVRARELGVELPEATPTFKIGLIAACEPPEPVELEMPVDFPLAHCYRLDEGFADRSNSDETNVHLLATLGKFDEPFIPVYISCEYDGYSWANLPTIGKVTVTAGPTLHSGYVGSGLLMCVESLTISVDTSDGKVYSSPVCIMAEQLPPDPGFHSDEALLVTREAETQLSIGQVWHHLGGYNGDGDTYDTQEREFEHELGRFWADVLGPDEQWRRGIVEASARMQPEWDTVTVRACGEIAVRFVDGTEKIVRPPPAKDCRES